MAVLLGPAGFGLFAMFLAISDLARSVAGMGINGSGVRQIAAAAAEDDRRVALTAVVLRRTALVLGVLGAGLLAAAAVPVAEASFGSRERVFGVAIVGLAVLFRVVAEAEAALLQGLRRIGDLAKINVLGPASVPSPVSPSSTGSAKRGGRFRRRRRGGGPRRDALVRPPGAAGAVAPSAARRNGRPRPS